MMFHANVPALFWFDAFATVTYVINRIPTPILDNKSPFELLYQALPNYENFKPFGCRVFPYLRDYAPNKLAPRSRPCIFMGYSGSRKGFRCYDPETSRVFITRHATFDELNFPFSGSSSTRSSIASHDITSFNESPGISSTGSTSLPHCKSCSHDVIDPLVLHP